MVTMPIEIVVPRPTSFESPSDLSVAEFKVSEDLSVPENPRIRGARIAIINNRWVSMEDISVRLAEELTALGAAETAIIPTLSKDPTPDDELDQVASRFDAAIVGLGN